MTQPNQECDPDEFPTAVTWKSIMALNVPLSREAQSEVRAALRRVGAIRSLLSRTQENMESALSGANFGEEWRISSLHLAEERLTDLIDDMKLTRSHILDALHANNQEQDDTA